MVYPIWPLWCSRNMPHWGLGSAAPQTGLNRGSLVAQLAKAHTHKTLQVLKSTLALLCHHLHEKKDKTKTNTRTKVSKQQLSKQTLFFSPLENSGTKEILTTKYSSAHCKRLCC